LEVKKNCQFKSDLNEKPAVKFKKRAVSYKRFLVRNRRLFFIDDDELGMAINALLALFPPLQKAH
jgi:hypothetical protein